MLGTSWGVVVKHQMGTRWGEENFQDVVLDNLNSQPFLSPLSR